MQLLPGMSGIAPAAAEFQIDAHWYIELHRFFTESGNQFRLLE